MSVIHYNNALNPTSFVVPICNPAGDRHVATIDPATVTCKRCRKVLMKR